ncbi:hypothetical protein ISF_05801 [Cordyceps fumosorosea ARSEF 2679]|uniref:Uncharacterized protein n=1 Tax=Cordyceps fumosorosea (strain ARSEF 2679) TaxID=1081104 RepID=A0A167TMV2_CORFA|nr:hypothetical protein ISF_05801 [Cordyceps fumosorosea ARSEF 2679]OAA60762.1 hypothetical protein ISF_05801 [Cordyceps fumosorosea ARSEF 2679]
MAADASTDVVVTPVSTDLIAATQANLAQKGDPTAAKSHTMIRIDGLSTNVHASDFYRLADNELSKWNQSITKVQQVRDRMTLEPTGTYNVTFSSAVAATAYATRFQRLHAIARIRANSRTGLWRSEVPAALLPSGGSVADTTTTQEDLEAELARLSLAAGVHEVALAHRRVNSGPESNKVRSASTRLSEQAAAQRERLDNVASGAEDVGEQQQQQQQQQQPFTEATGQDDDGVEDGKQRLGAVLRKRDGLRRVARHLEGAALRRFVVAFRDRAEAQRFHRLWNGRWLGGRDVPPAAGAPRHFVRTQVLDY